MAADDRNIDFTKLIPELQLWNNGQGIDIESWLSCVGSYEHAVAYGRLFWPEFTIHDGCVLFAGFNEESYRGFMESTNGHKRSVETVMNHRHILDLFPDVSEDPSEELIVYLGRLLKDMWAAKLARDFPERRIIVSFPEDPGDDLLDYEITFFQENDEREAV